MRVGERAQRRAFRPAPCSTGDYAPWVGFLAVAPLALLLPTGLYLFVLPYAAKWRSGRGAGG